MSALRCYNFIEITQQPSVKYPDRNKVISLDYLNRYEVVTAWDNLTDTAKVTFPKNVIAKDTAGNDVPLQGDNINIGTGINPLFLRGDKINIKAGYWYYDSFGVEQQYVRLLFDGYINKVTSKLAITLECEDNMWLLKQIPAPDKIWGAGISFQSILTECLKGSEFERIGGKVKTESQTSIEYNIGTFYTKGETVSQVLARMKKDLQMSAYLKGTELRVGRPTYWPSDIQDASNPFNFVFQKNIISDNLQYMRKDDIIMSATAQSFYSENQSATTKDGQTKTRQKKLMVFIWADKKTQQFKSKVITDTSQIPANEAGERYSFHFPFAKTATELTNLAINELQKKYYTGFKGDFTTFGMPFIPYGDNIKIVDPVVKDRDGVYKVKGVNYSGGIGLGIRQQIFLDYKVEA